MFYFLGQYAQLYQQQQAQQHVAQQQAAQHAGAAQLYAAAPPTYEQALGHPSLTAAQAQQHHSSAWVSVQIQSTFYGL